MIWSIRLIFMGPHKETKFGHVSTSGAVDHCSVGVAFPRHALITTKHYFFGAHNVRYTPDLSHYLLVYGIGYSTNYVDDRVTFIRWLSLDPDKILNVLEVTIFHSPLASATCIPQVVMLFGLHSKATNKKLMFTCKKQI